MDCRRRKRANPTFPGADHYIFECLLLTADSNLGNCNCGPNNNDYHWQTPSNNLPALTRSQNTHLRTSRICSNESWSFLKRHHMLLLWVAKLIRHCQWDKLARTDTSIAERRTSLKKHKAPAVTKLQQHDDSGAWQTLLQHQRYTVFPTKGPCNWYTSASILRLLLAELGF